ncbi:MAG: hypothetical protein ABR928_02050 [Terracidiphilus sp.]
MATATWILPAWLACAAACYAPLNAQEADSGFNVRTTLSGLAATSNILEEAPRNGVPGTAGFRGVVYPSWKIDNNWFATGAVQLFTRPYFYSDFSASGFGVKGNILQASLNYTRISDKGSLLLRAGELSSAFGSFLLRYDDADNPLIDIPSEYGYYYSQVSTFPVAAGEIDLTRGKWDGRAQFANSSPANPRSILAHDQYANWAGGMGYSIHQGFRIGVSGYRGPYLDKQYESYYTWWVSPRSEPARALGLDASFARNHSSVQVEVQKFVMPNSVVPTYVEWDSYAEFKQTLSPRWYVAMRPLLTRGSGGYRQRSVETAAVFRPNRFQILKLDYEIVKNNSTSPHNENTLAIQLVTTLGWSAAGRN